MNDNVLITRGAAKETAKRILETLLRDHGIGIEEGALEELLAEYDKITPVQRLMSSEEFIFFRDKMCQEFQVNGRCFLCGLHSSNNGECSGCDDYIKRHPNRASRVVYEWAKAQGYQVTPPIQRNDKEKPSTAIFSKHRWIHMQWGQDYYVCPVCKYENGSEPTKCPNCGTELEVSGYAK